MDGTLMGITIPGQSRIECNGNEGVHYIPQIFRTRVLLSDALKCHTQDTLLRRGGGITSLQEI